MSLALPELREIYEDAREVQKIHHGLSGRYLRNLRREIEEKEPKQAIEITIKPQEVKKENEVELHAI